jgi:hypothetical protein
LPVGLGNDADAGWAGVVNSDTELNLWQDLSTYLYNGLLVNGVLVPALALTVVVMIVCNSLKEALL